MLDREIESQLDLHTCFFLLQIISSKITNSIKFKYRSDGYIIYTQQASERTLWSCAHKLKSEHKCWYRIEFRVTYEPLIITSSSIPWKSVHDDFFHVFFLNSYKPKQKQPPSNINKPCAVKRLRWISGEREKEALWLSCEQIICVCILYACLHVHDVGTREDHMLFHIFIESIGGSNFSLFISFVCASAKISRQIIHFCVFTNASKMIVFFFWRCWCWLSAVLCNVACRSHERTRASTCTRTQTETHVVTCWQNS